MLSHINFNEELSLIRYSIKSSSKKVEKKEVIPQNQRVHRVFIEDCSGSMSSELPKIRDQLKNKLPRIVNENDLISIIWFSGRGQCGVVQEAFCVKSLPDIQVLNNMVDKWLKPVCLTGFVDPLRVAKELILRSKKNHPDCLTSLCFMTDGEDNQYTNDQILNAVEELKGLIDSATFVEYRWECNRALMLQMAERVGGSLIFNEDFPEYDDLVVKEATKVVKGNGKMQKIVLQDVPLYGFIYSVSEDSFGDKKDVSETSINFYAITDNNEVIVPEHVETLYYLVSRREGKSITQFLNTELSDVYVLLSVLSQRMKAVEIYDILKAMGEVSLFKQFINCYSKQEYLEFQRECLRLSYRPDYVFAEGRDTSYIPDEDAYTLNDFLVDLVSDENNKIVINRFFKYNRISTKKVPKEVKVDFNKIKNYASDLDSLEGLKYLKDIISTELENNDLVFGTTVPENEGFDISDLVYNSERPNVSIRLYVPGRVKLPKNNFDKLPEYLDTFQYKTYTVIRDGIVNTPVLPCRVSEKTFNKLRSVGVLTGNAVYIPNRVYGIECKNIPLINRKMIKEISTVAEKFLTENVELQAMKAIQKVFKNKDTSEKKSSKFEALYGKDATIWLKTIGITEYNGFDPELIEVKTGDSYNSKEMKVSIKGCSSLPKVEDVEKKMLEKKKLTTVQELIALGIKRYSQFMESDVYKMSFDQDKLLRVWLATETVSIIEKVRMLNKDINKTKLAVMLTHTWFFPTLEENSMTVNYNGTDYECSIELKDSKIEI